MPSRIARAGLTQALGIMNRHSINRVPTSGELWIARLLTAALSLVCGYFAYKLWHAYLERSAPVFAGAVVVSVLCVIFLFFFLRSVFSKPRRPGKKSLVGVFVFVALIGCFWAWLAFSVGWPDNLRSATLAVALLATGIFGVFSHR